MIGEGTKWAEKEAERLADVKRINEVLEFVRKEKKTLETYAEGMLSTVMTTLYATSSDLAVALKDVNYLATDMKNKAINTKEYINMVDEAEDPEEYIEVWEITLESLLDTLDSCYKKTGVIRVKLETITSDLT